MKIGDSVIVKQFLRDVSITDLIHKEGVIVASTNSRLDSDRNFNWTVEFSSSVVEELGWGNVIGSRLFYFLEDELELANISFLDIEI